MSPSKSARNSCMASTSSAVTGVLCGGRLSPRWSSATGRMSLASVMRRLARVELDADDGDGMAATAATVEVDEVEAITLRKQADPAVAVGPLAGGACRTRRVGCAASRAVHSSLSLDLRAIRGVRSGRGGLRSGDGSGDTRAAPRRILPGSMSHARAPKADQRRAVASQLHEGSRSAAAPAVAHGGPGTRHLADDRARVITASTSCSRPQRCVPPSTPSSLLLMEDHVAGCLATAVKTGDATAYTEEVMEVVRRSMGRPVRARAAD